VRRHREPETFVEWAGFVDCVEREMDSADHLQQDSPAVREWIERARMLDGIAGDDL
jgi:hypothetical protein